MGYLAGFSAKFLVDGRVYLSLILGGKFPIFQFWPTTEMASAKILTLYFPKKPVQCDRSSSCLNE